jgi:DpnD/PcfM-like protein
MKKYKVTLVRAENIVYLIEVDAESESRAEELAQEKWDSGDIDLDRGVVVHGEEFINQVEEIIPE